MKIRVRATHMMRRMKAYLTIARSPKIIGKGPMSTAPPNRAFPTLLTELKAIKMRPKKVSVMPRITRDNPKFINVGSVNPHPTITFSKNGNKNLNT